MLEENDLLAQLGGGGTPPKSGPPSSPGFTESIPPPPVSYPLSPPPPKTGPGSGVGKKPGERTYKSRVPAILTDPITGENIRLNKKQRQIVDVSTRYSSHTKVANVLHTSKDKVAKTFNLPAVQAYFRTIMQEGGLTDALIVKRIKERMDATVKKEFLTKEGEIISGEERPDHEQRGRAIDQALRLQGLDKPPEPGAAHMPQVNINISSLSVEELKALVAHLATSASTPGGHTAPSVEDAEILPPDGEEDNGG